MRFPASSHHHATLSLTQTTSIASGTLWRLSEDTSLWNSLLFNSNHLARQVKAANAMIIFWSKIMSLEKPLSKFQNAFDEWK